MSHTNNEQRTLETIDDDMVMAVFNGDESRIAQLQRERMAIAERVKKLDIL